MTMYKPAMRKSVLVALSAMLLASGCQSAPTGNSEEETTIQRSEAIVQDGASSEEASTNKASDQKPTDAEVASEPDVSEQSKNAPVKDDAVSVSDEPANSAPFPVADDSGDFSRRTGYNLWQVSDTDPAGVNCRWSPEMPEEWYSPAEDWSDTDFQNWPVARTFEYGTKLVSDGSPAGFMRVVDSRGLPWLKIKVGDNNQICLIRANTRYIVPRS